MLVGGFAKNKYVQSTIKNVTNNRKLIIPDEPGLAVLRGSVLFGHYTKVITSRKMRYTYGVAGTVPYNKKIHPKSSKCVIHGKPMVRNAFIIFIKANDDVKPGTEITKECSDPQGGERNIVIPIFRSNSENPILSMIGIVWKLDK